jgi:hypothetical protein
MGIPSLFLGLANDVPDTFGSNGEAIRQTELKDGPRTLVVFLNGHGQLSLVRMVRDVDLLDHETEEMSVYLDGAAFLFRDTHRSLLHRS